MTTISALADKSDKGFQDQTTAFTAMAGAMSSTITAMKEAASYAERLTREYVQQNAMLQAATGTGGQADVSCTRPSKWQVRFNVSHDDGTGGAAAAEAAAANASSPTNATRRRLQQAAADASNGTTGGSTGSGSSTGSVVYVGGTELVQWQGYRLAVHAREANRGVDDSRAPERPRYVGAGRANRVVGGLFLHTTRDPPPRACAPGSVAAALSFDCERSFTAGGAPLLRNATYAAERLAAWLAARDGDTAPYGVDPSFLRSSGLYNPDLVGDEKMYYNVSDKGEVSEATGAPYGFFYKSLQGYPPGFPILVANKMGAKRAGEAVQYLLDGNYVDR